MLEINKGNKLRQIREQILPNKQTNEETGNQEIDSRPTAKESSDFLGKIMNHEISMFSLEQQKVFMSLGTSDSEFFFFEGIIERILLQNNDYKLGILIDGQKYNEVLKELGLPLGNRFYMQGYPTYIVIKLQKTNDSVKACYTDIGSGLEINVLIKLAN